jgi:hypothetical protein
MTFIELALVCVAGFLTVAVVYIAVEIAMDHWR